MIGRIAVPAVERAGDGVELDGLAQAEAVADLDAAEEVAAAPPARVVELWGAAPAAHRARLATLGDLTEALGRAVARPGRPGEPPAETRMREVAARYLELRLAVAEGLARITIG